MTETTCIQEFIDHLGITTSAFEDKCGLGSGTISKGRGRSNFSRTTLSRIANAFPQLNMDWVRTGNGMMLNPATITAGDNSANAIGGNATTNVGNKMLLRELAELRRMLDEALRENRELTARYLAIIEKLTK